LYFSLMMVLLLSFCWKYIHEISNLYYHFQMIAVQKNATIKSSNYIHKNIIFNSFPSSSLPIISIQFISFHFNSKTSTKIPMWRCLCVCAFVFGLIFFFFTFVPFIHFSYLKFFSFINEKEHSSKRRNVSHHMG